MMNLMDVQSKPQKVIVLGATGLIGFELVKRLLQRPEVSQVVTIGRRAPNIDDSKLKSIEIDLERIDDHGAQFEGVHAVFCCLGTTMKDAKTRDAFKRVDFDYPLLSAKISKCRGVEHFLVVSAQGASSHSSFFYSRVKGDLERVLQSIPFKRLTIARPGLLLGRKGGTRPMEDMAVWFLRGLKPLWRGPLQKYQAVHARDVAEAMIQSFLGNDSSIAGLELLEFKQES